MSAPNDGGPAFPRTGADGHTSPQTGMTLRDWFAGQALSGALASPEEPEGDSYEEKRERICRVCYEYADSMLAARAKKETTS